MKKIFPLLILNVMSFFYAQEFTLNELFQYQYYPQGIQGGISMNDGEHYTVMSDIGIDKYSYKTFQKVETIKSGNYANYFFNNDESFLILETEPEAIFRHSKKAIYTLYNMKNQTETLVFEGKKIQEPTLSPDGEKVAFVFENNLYFQNLTDGKITQITSDGEKNKIINGVTDWVYEEEFGFVRAFDWNATSNQIAFIRLDESEVPEMNIDIYGKSLYPNELKFKYPKAGEKNAVASVHIFDLNSKALKNIDLSDYQDFYVPKIQFSKKTNDLAVLVSNRHQNHVDFWMVNTQNLNKKKLFTETDKAWIETDHLTLEFLADNSFIWSSERDGFRHLYHYADNGKLLNQITKGNWEVTEFYGYSPENKRVYFQSTEPGSIYRGVYSVGLNGKKKITLANQKGVNNATFSKSFAYFILSNDAANRVPVYTLNSGKNGARLSILEDNQTAQNYWDLKQPQPKIYEEIEVNGTKLNTYMIKPKDFDPNKKYPLFMYLYGGPGSQQVLYNHGGFNFWWFQVLANHGYIVVCVDNRGTGGKGSDFKKITYRNLGHYEIEDQMAAAKYFGNLDYIDENRIGMFGWSFGGYMTSLAMTKGADIFKTGIAVAPVTNWRFYDTIYTERFLQTPQENPDGYDKNSPIHYADLMKGNFMLIHGTADDNVHVQNAMQFAEALIQANKDFEYMLYPDKNHGIYGGNTRRHLYEKITNFILKKL
ncbi:Prolyl tripeptidyl peptidase precursor [Candidatus Ornithobacterium hominis]|uniref:S9 family peptidase n=1 Tax=Candidatus Ornithobacterium hominis TaxID=2497989 RepID=UPI000E5BFE90|nr:S9 family peptidase [Candidatus Ornithobacterium hominis]SZD71886.1 Prolyl tripeptidyl peptidase precursor [Candidatus Ornithobacterium hominis]